ncbi:T9SS type A sorting domain-containing protein [candidate division KSB1 bacterium]|nr:T9SS type A sorting domain-containing protein [candidate division KSB1 bacterium]
MIAFLLISMCCCIGLAYPRVLRVPLEIPTIQAALDSTSSGDTVLVGMHEYYEALLAPAHTFYLLGDVAPDTGDFARPTVDPSLMTDPVPRGCLTIPDGADAIVRNFRFRTRTSIAERAHHSGIVCGEAHAVFEYCVMESLRTGLRAIAAGSTLISLDHCIFRADSFYCIYAHQTTVTADYCDFSGPDIYQLLCGSGSRITNCHFRDGDHTLLGIGGIDVVVRGCVFGPSPPLNFPALVCDNFGGSIIDNVFSNLQQGQEVLGVTIDCAQPLRITGNTFYQNRGAIMQPRAQIRFSCLDGDQLQPVVLERNVLAACSVNGLSKALSIVAGVRAFRNRISDMQPPRVPAVHSNTTDSVVFRENVFMNNGFGMTLWNGEIDARWNYWGDSTGPFHPDLNPGGLGDEVSDFVLFEPWHPDTSFLDLPDPRAPSPTEFSLSVYPNPFNGHTRIRFVAPEPGVYSLELFDLLGRRVAEIWNGPSIATREIHFDASMLSSGIYFVRAKDAIFNRPLATQKLVLLR